MRWPDADFFKWRKGRTLLASVLLSWALLWLADWLGVPLHLRELDYDTQFRYPLEVDALPLVRRLQRGEAPEDLLPPPANPNDTPFTAECREKCEAGRPVQLLLLVKSAAQHLERRQAIRQTWGRERRPSGVQVRRVFVLGRRQGSEAAIADEIRRYGDVVQADFVDDYSNNTLKMMSSLKWAVRHCPSAQYVLFSDDDFYVSVKNVMRFIRNPVGYPLHSDLSNDEPTADERLFAGYVLQSTPHRHRFSKWFVTLAEYPFSLWPPYATAGAFVVSRQVLLDLFYGSFYTKLFRFDDIYLALVALKVGLTPMHSPHFHFAKKSFTVEGYRDVIASHGYDDPAELRRVWHQLEGAGHA